jgi:hypothetical protein
MTTGRINQVTSPYGLNSGSAPSFLMKRRHEAHLKCDRIESPDPKHQFVHSVVSVF